MNGNHGRSAQGRACGAETIKMQIRCLIVDDNQPFLDAARLLLEREGVAVVGVATTSAEALRLEEELRPDVVLVDIRLGDESGFDLAQRLSGTVILISTLAHQNLVVRQDDPRRVGAHRNDYGLP
jgi:DNA-binding NarL/FixJ family response regulator